MYWSIRTFIAIPSDVTREETTYGWRGINFHHIEQPEGSGRLLSFVDIAGNYNLLAATTNSQWYPQLIPESYCFNVNQPDVPFLPASAGLGGRLPFVIAIVAFSCRPENLEQVLVGDNAWLGNTWLRHGYATGRESISLSLIHRF